MCSLLWLSYGERLRAETTEPLAWLEMVYGFHTASTDCLFRAKRFLRDAIRADISNCWSSDYCVGGFSSLRSSAIYQWKACSFNPAFTVLLILNDHQSCSSMKKAGDNLLRGIVSQSLRIDSPTKVLRSTGMTVPRTDRGAWVSSCDIFDKVRAHSRFCWYHLAACWG